MKRLASTLLFFIQFALATVAQDFKLYYAKNVTDVTQFSNLEAMSKELHWREVANGSIDGNRNDVDKVKAMLSETRMKGLEDQRLFWKMRDEMLLCFRIEDTGAKSGSFRVEVVYGQDSDGKDIKKTLTTRKYFFANMPLDCDSVAIHVYRIKDPSQRINFRYFVYDWDDENVYIFQLDQKRQSTGDTYKMEYVTSYADAEGDIHSQSQVLELKETKFQSFYVPKDHTLTDVYFLTGNENEGDVKLRMDMNEIHPTIDIDHQLEIPSLTPTFRLDKHENRELMNFNWVGTGLFEKYDTLYIKLFDNKSKPIANATMRVHRVDEEGNLVNDESLKFEGYDSHSKQYKVLTYGHPAYVEILHDEFLPLLYRYKGAADATSKIVSPDLCSAKITMKKGNVEEYKKSIAVSDLYFRYMRDKAITIRRDNKDYSVMYIDEQNISGRGLTDIVSFMDNGGNDYLKLVDNQPIEKFGQLEVVFSAPPGSGNTSCKLVAKETKSQETHEATAVETRVITAEKFGFTRDYYFVRYDMAKTLPRNKQCDLTLNASGASYNKFPPFLNKYVDTEKKKKEAKEQANSMINTKDCREDGQDFFSKMDWGIELPLDFKFSLGSYCTIKTGILFDFLKSLINIYTNVTVSSDFYHDDNEEARNNAKAIQDYRMRSLFQTGPENNRKDQLITAADPKFKFEDWMAQEMESIFQVQAKHVGLYVQGGGNLVFRINTEKEEDESQCQLDEVSLFGTLGYGKFFALDKMIGGKPGEWIRALSEKTKERFVFDAGMQFDANLRLDLGIKSYGAKKKNQWQWSSEDKGFFTNITVNGIAGAWIGFKTKGWPIINADFGARVGGKFQIGWGLVVPFSDEKTCNGFRFMGCAGFEGHLNIRAFFAKFAWRGGWRFGGEQLLPDNNTNPFHALFPYWLPDEDKKINRRVLNLSLLRTPEPNSFGQILVNNVNYDANPHFLDENHVVYNDLGNADDLNDEHISLATVANDAPVSTEALSVPGTIARQQARSQRGDKEVVVYQQTTQTIDNNAATNENSSAMEDFMLQHTQIKAVVRQSDGTWKQTVVTPDDGFIDQNPLVSVQEDGKAAVVYQHGKIAFFDENESSDLVYDKKFEGELLLRTYDPATGWSDPKTVWYYNDNGWPLKYDLIMRNDSVLVAAMLEEPSNPVIGAFAGKYTRYGWTTTKMDKMFYTHEDLHAVDFCLSRVGEHGVMTLLYERPDSTREIFVKTVNMDGTDDSLAGSDLGIGHTIPYKVKIISNRDDNHTDDFAILWTEQSSTARDAENGNKALKNYYAVLNGSRIHLSDAPQITYPLTLGVERDGMQMHDFDGYLDDARIKVLYTLTDTATNVSVIMQNEKEFTNSFESDVTYSREALLGSSTLPVNVDIMNTGTSAIKAATVTINGQEIAIPNAFVAPMQQERFVVQYPIPEEFDGYMQSSVEVEYANVFKAKQQTGRRAAPRSLLRQHRAFARHRVATGNIDCNVINHSVENGINTFVVEIIDYSSRGLAPGTAVQVGAYAHPSAMETVSDEANILVRPEAFTRMGGVRKAYAEVKVSGITEEIAGYIAAHIVDLDVDEDADEEDKRITNVCPTAGPSYVVFHPTGEPTDISNPKVERSQEHRVNITTLEGGVQLGNLEPGEDVRIFSAEGITVHMERPTSNTLFVPLRSHGVFILSAGKEVFKFTY